MENYTVEELNSLFQLYLSKCDDKLKDEEYGTDREFAEQYISNFLLWLRENEDL